MNNPPGKTKKRRKPPRRTPKTRSRIQRVFAFFSGDSRERAWQDSSGSAVARVFHGMLALIFFIAWLSLGSQVNTLIGSRGLLPFLPFAESARQQGTPFSELPTLFLYAPGDAVLSGCAVAGAALSLIAFAGIWPRLCFACMTALYLSFAVAGRTFFSFQWDNMLLECGLLATLLPRTKSAPWIHFLFRALIFKLYLESGIAKWQSSLGDWHDGSAMTFYYETAPLPTRLAYFAHFLPASYHHLESWFALFLELAVPFAVFGPRWARLSAFTAFSVFQFADIATANYGFFCYLSLSTHVFLLSDRDLGRARRRIERRLPFLKRLRARTRLLRMRLGALPRRFLRFAPSTQTRRHLLTVKKLAAFAFFSVYLSISGLEGWFRFGGPSAQESARDLASLRSLYLPFRLINTYHLFASITRARIEPEIQSFDGHTWTSHDLRYKPGDPARAPSFAAPHQPRLDFQLWFYGLGHTRGMPAYVSTLLTRLCSDPSAVQPFFEAELPAHPRAVRIAFFRYHFAPPGEHRDHGLFWTREWISSTPELACPAISKNPQSPR